MNCKFTTKYKENIKDDAKADARTRANFVRKIVFDNLYTFDDSEIRNGRKPKVLHNIKIEGVSLNEEEFELIEKVAKHYNMTVTKLVSFIINQYYENKEDK